MASALAGNDLAQSASSHRSWTTTSFREILAGPTADMFSRRDGSDDEEELRWAAIERLPTYDRMRKAVLRQVLENGKVVSNEVDVTKLGSRDKKVLMESILKIVEEDNEKFLRRLKNRIDRVGIKIPKIEVRYEDLSVEGDVYVGKRALPTLLNVTMNTIESILGLFHVVPSKKTRIKILQEVRGIVKPSRMTLLLGPPSAGKTTFLLALAGKLDKDLKVNGRVTYCGHELNEFVPLRTCAYISQHDLHYGEMTVRETLDFSGRCLGVGTRYEMLIELSRRERKAGIKPDPEIDAFMKAIAVSGQERSLVTDYVLKLLGLDICADTIVGDEMRRGISGGQKKRVTVGEMLVGSAKVLLMDEISTGLDSSTTFQIIKYMRQMVHIMDVTTIISLLQPTPETFALFDDIILLSEGQIIYQGPRENVLEFFQYMGFKCPERKGVADFLQEVTSKKDQEQYWFKDQPYTYISVPEFVQGFNSFYLGQQLELDIKIPYNKSKTHPAAFVTKKFGISNWELSKACFSREWLLIKRSSFVHIFKAFKLTVVSIFAFTVFLRTEMPAGNLQDGGKFFGALFFTLSNIMFNGTAELSSTASRLPVFYKQRDFLFYPAWAFALPMWVLRIPLSFLEASIWIVFTYYTIGFAPAASRFFRHFLALFGIHQMAVSLFRFIAAVGRTPVISGTLANLSLLLFFVLGGFIIAKDDIKPWMIWGYYASPIMYGQSSIVMNEFLDKRWSTPNTDHRYNETTVGKVLLGSRGFFKEEHWFWICIGALFGFSLIFNVLFIGALRYLNSIGNSKTVITGEYEEKKKTISSSGEHRKQGTELAAKASEIVGISYYSTKRGMVFPFKPLSLAFDHVNYSVDTPGEIKNQGVDRDRLQLLKDVSGAFRPGILTALVGVSGAGKTTLMDVLAGRKSGGYIEGSISISGYPKNQTTFARVSGYCEQNDIHSPHVTVYESLLYSAWLRLSSDIDTKTRQMFVDEVMELVELKPLADALVGLPGVNGLSTEQRKRLTIAVELVANPSIIFMDEPTSGLDARAAAIVMHTVRNIGDTGRTILCTIHQPSIDIFEAFDELLLMKRGGQVIYSGPLGQHSHKLIEYFEAIPGVPQIKDGYNPAAWMLDVTAPSMEAELGVDFAELYSNSSLYQRNQQLISELNTPAPDSNDLFFSTKYAQPLFTQCKACLWKQHWSYWRNAPYNAVRLLVTMSLSLGLGLIFWNKGQKIEKQQDLMNLSGAMYSAVFFLGSTNAYAVQSVVATERTVLYRERAAGMYSALAYAFSQVAIEMIYVAIQTVLYSIPLYAMIGLEWKVVNFLWFYYLLLMCLMYFTSYGMMLVALTPGQQFAAILVSFFTNLWNLFSGFFIPRMQIPVWWRWHYWASPMAWTIYGLVTSQVGDKSSSLEVPGAGTMPLKLYLKNNFGYDHDFLPVIAVAHIGWVLLFFFVFACGIKFLNFQRR